ncbi:hypothetical protein MTR_7g075260 [Medicago truncatula]|uniref:Uncharacterized protein n=1 Tax=Medicago truncatula TaxID=3880 RepID=G7L0C0_MEDTR|nr:hypothetical protein MTR_7g075260 [Medicago truncatula]
MEELKMMIDSLKIQELRYDELIKLKALLLKLRKIVMDDISIRRGEIASHGKGYGMKGKYVVAEDTPIWRHWEIYDELEISKPWCMNRREEVSVVFSSSFIGKDDETIEESHIYKLPFLQAIVKKTIGLHPPPGPLLIM